MEIIDIKLEDNPRYQGAQPKANTIYKADFAFNKKSDEIEKTFSEGLTKYAAGYSGEGVFKELNFLAPPVPVSSRLFEYKVFGDGDITMDTNDERAKHGDFIKISRPNSELIGTLINRGLEIVIDNSERMEGCEEAAIRFLIKRLARNELSRAYALAKKICGSTTEKSWSTSTSKPDSDLKDLIRGVGEGCGAQANRVLMASAAWEIRAERYEETPSGILSAQQVADKLGLDSMTVSKEYYVKKSASGITRLPVLSDGYVFAFNGDNDISNEDFSTMKRFCTDFKAYKEEGKKCVRISVEHYSALIETSPGSINALKII